MRGSIGNQALSACSISSENVVLLARKYSQRQPIFVSSISMLDTRRFGDDRCFDDDLPVGPSPVRKAGRNFQKLAVNSDTVTLPRLYYAHRFTRPHVSTVSALPFRPSRQRSNIPHQRGNFYPVPWPPAAAPLTTGSLSTWLLFMPRISAHAVATLPYHRRSTGTFLSSSRFDLTFAKSYTDPHLLLIYFIIRPCVSLIHL